MHRCELALTAICSGRCNCCLQQWPKDEALLDLLYELCVDAGERADDEAARAFLSGIRTGGKTGKLGDRLLALR
jgi:hypothetical protein